MKSEKQQKLQQCRRANLLTLVRCRARRLRTEEHGIVSSASLTLEPLSWDQQGVWLLKTLQHTTLSRNDSHKALCEDLGCVSGRALMFFGLFFSGKRKALKCLPGQCEICWVFFSCGCIIRYLKQFFSSHIAYCPEVLINSNHISSHSVRLNKTSFFSYLRDLVFLLILVAFL